MARRRGTLTETDHADWAHFTRQIVPLRGRTRPVARDTPPPAPVAVNVPPPRMPANAARAMPSPVSIGDHPGGIDTGTWQRFRVGKLTAVRKLDLHGMTTQHAYHALIGFLRSAYTERLRCVEVVTGRGTREGGGTLRRELPMWLNQPDIRPLILAAAHPHAANPGSVRILLRRHR